MIINNVEIFFNKEVGDKLFFNTNSGEEIIIDKKLLRDFSDKDKKLFLTLGREKLLESPTDVLNDILESQG